jgi:hydroxymethylbilane synthase
LEVDVRGRETASESAGAFIASALPYLPHGAKVGTSSLRRKAQLLALRPDLDVDDVRGNIDTRLRKLEEQFDAIVLARAGLERLAVEIDHSRLHDFNEREFVPAPGQGALAIEARTDDAATLRLLAALDDAATRAEIGAERATMRALNAGCSTPLGARAVFENGRLKLWAAVLSPDGTRRVFAEDEDEAQNARTLGERMAQRLLEMGATDLMVC